MHILLSIFILKAGDIEINPGPKKIPHLNFSCCHWNVNSLATDNYSKVLALKAYNFTDKYDFICICWNILSKLGRPIQHTIYSINNPVGLKLLTRLRLGLSYLNEHRFNHNFQNCIIPLCSCNIEIESTYHFLLNCHHYTNICVLLLNSITEIIGNTFNINYECLVNLLLFGSQKYTEIDNSHIANATIKYLLDSGRFNGPLL